MRTFGKIIFSVVVIFLGFNILMTLNGISRNKAYADFGDQAYSDNDFNSLKKVFHYYYDDFIFEADEDDFNIKIINGAVYLPKSSDNSNFLIVFLSNKNLDKNLDLITLKLTSAGTEEIVEKYDLLPLSKKGTWYMQIVSMESFLNEDKKFEDIIKLEISIGEGNIVKTYEDEKLMSKEDYDLVKIIDNEEDLESFNIVKTNVLSNLRKYRWINWVGMISYLFFVGIVVYLIYFRKSFKIRKRIKNSQVKEAEVIEVTKKEE